MTESNSQPIRIFAVYAAFAALLVLGINVFAPWSGLVQAARAPVHDGQVHTINSVADFEAMLAQDRAALFVDAEWSMTTAIMRPVFADYARSPTCWCAPERFYRLDVTADTNDALTVRSQEWMDAQGLPEYGMKTFHRAGMVIWTQRGDVSNYVQTHCWPESPVDRFYAALVHWTDGLPFYLLAALLVPAMAAFGRARWRFSLRSLAMAIAVIALGCLLLDPHRALATRLLIRQPRFWWYWYGGTILALFVVSSLLTLLYFVVRRLRRRSSPRDAHPASSLEH